MKFDRRLLTHFEWLLPLLSLAVSALGVMTVYSATHAPGAEGWSPLAFRQLAWLAASFAVMLGVLLFDYRRLDRSAYFVYLLVLLAVLAVPILGRIGGGSRRWIRVGPASIQPSEFMKLALVLVLSRHFSRTPGARLGLRELVVPLVLTAFPAAAILAQPDLGTVAVLGVVSVTMFVLGGVQLRWLAAVTAPVTVLAPLLWGHLKTYQQRRVLTFLNPDLDPLGAGYHVIQSKIAVGSGLVWGKGFLRGTQNHLNFLPEQHTDFIFSVWAEEHGFLGGVLLVSLYGFLVLSALDVAANARDKFGSFLAIGMAALFFWHAFINVGMVTGILPVVGVPLPLFSYGGSSVLADLLGVGILLSVSLRRFMF